MTNLPNIGKPATNALRQLDITTLEQIAIHDEKNAFKNTWHWTKSNRYFERSNGRTGHAF